MHEMVEYVLDGHPDWPACLVWGPGRMKIKVRGADVEPGVLDDLATVTQIITAPYSLRPLDAPRLTPLLNVRIHLIQALPEGTTFTVEITQDLVDVGIPTGAMSDDMASALSVLLTRFSRFLDPAQISPEMSNLPGHDPTWKAINGPPDQDVQLPG
ncbi:hypothetical protein [Spongiactinospora sp. TRM90649]|uniref:hypothetical protein n=1 Tax=Spongiactinospora sp. TRM90649 TaxID=3031114 RepID=UPI0023F8352A|nr:hypothetical protein [Spongiactinospora sp. TRM90649]MDF5758556.1 hypothetical protein [Spongiactinospora sp. TRM90649]